MVQYSNAGRLDVIEQSSIILCQPGVCQLSSIPKKLKPQDTLLSEVAELRSGYFITRDGIHCFGRSQ
jgi:hypothetical protein